MPLISKIQLPIANTNSLGAVKPDGTTITIDSNGVLSGSNQYVLPTATTNILGGVKPDGTTVTIDSNGVISSNSYTKSESDNNYVKKYLSYKSYTEDYANSSSLNGSCTGFDREFAQVTTTDYSQPWFIKIFIKTNLNDGTNNHYSYHTVEISCLGNATTPTYKIFNIFQDETYKSIHYICVYKPQSLAKSQNAPFRLCFRGGDIMSTNTNPRSYDIYLLEQINCVCTLNNTIDNQAYQKWYYNDHEENAYYWSSTNNGVFNYSDFDLRYAGLSETGDDDSLAYDIYLKNGFQKAGTNGIGRKTIIMMDSDGKYQSIVNQSNNITYGEKTANTAQFRLDKQIYYYNSNIDKTADQELTSGDTSVLSTNNIADLRYSFNVDNTSSYCLIAKKPLYLVGTIDSSGYFKLDTLQWWSQEEPSTEDGKIYIYLGIVYNDTYPYRSTMELYNKTILWYKNGKVRNYPETGVLFTTTEKTKLDGIATGANNYTLPYATTNTLGGIKVGSNLTIDENGVLSAGSSYTLPTASSSTLGGIKIGNDLNISDGVVNINTSSSTFSTVHCIIEAYVNGQSGYRIWDDGYCEQWGVSVGTSKNGNSIIFLKTFIDSNYCLLTDFITHSTSDVYNYFKSSVLSTTGFTWYLWQGSSLSANGKVISWKAGGYLATDQY